jgi:hypothetical protein
MLGMDIGSGWVKQHTERFSSSFQLEIHGLKTCGKSALNKQEMYK